MVKRPTLIILIGACAAAAIGIRLSQQAPSNRASIDPAHAKTFFAAPQKYDMTTGQEMRPRW